MERRKGRGEKEGERREGRGEERRKGRGEKRREGRGVVLDPSGL